MNTLQIKRSARFVAIGNPKSTKVALVLHGYGQLSRYFIKWFEELTELGYYVVAPEGLHRFYVEGFSGRVGASWMTKEWREQDIAENCAYLDDLVYRLKTDMYIENLIVIGFSQGGSTAYRWLSQTHHKINHFINWASSFPDDLSEQQRILKFISDKDFFIGDQDEFYSSSLIDIQKKLYNQYGFKTHEYKGGHRIEVGVLLKFLKY